MSHVRDAHHLPVQSSRPKWDVKRLTVVSACISRIIDTRIRLKQCLPFKANYKTVAEPIQCQPYNGKQIEWWIRQIIIKEARGNYWLY